MGLDNPIPALGSPAAGGARLWPQRRAAWALAGGLSLMAAGLLGIWGLHQRAAQRQAAASAQVALGLAALNPSSVGDEPLAPSPDRAGAAAAFAGAVQAHPEGAIGALARQLAISTAADGAIEGRDGDVDGDGDGDGDDGLLGGLRQLHRAQAAQARGDAAGAQAALLSMAQNPQAPLGGWAAYWRMRQAQAQGDFGTAEAAWSSLELSWPRLAQQPWAQQGHAQLRAVAPQGKAADAPTPAPPAAAGAS